MNGRARKLEAHRHGDKARPHDAVISSEKFGAIGGENGNAISAPQPARAERAGDAVRHGIELAVADLARDPAGEVDDRNLAQIAIARNKIAKVGERGHTDTLSIASCRREAWRTNCRCRGRGDTSRRLRETRCLPKGGAAPI